MNKINLILILGIACLLVLSGCNLIDELYKENILGVCYESLGIVDLCQLEINESISEAYYDENNIIGCCWRNTLYGEEMGYYTERKCRGILNKDLTKEVHNVTWRWCVPDEWREYK